MIIQAHQRQSWPSVLNTLAGELYYHEARGVPVGTPSAPGISQSRYILATDSQQ
jgi:hypothetical protein